MGLVVVSFTFWVVIAALTIRDNMDEVHELYDIHLVHTALALLRLTDTAPNSPPLIAGSAASSMIERLFSQWPDLPDRVTQAKHTDSTQSRSVQSANKVVVDRNVQYGKGLRYQIWRQDGRMLFRSANAPDSVITDETGFSENADQQGQNWRHYSVWNRSHEVRVIVSEAHDMRMQLVRSLAISSISPIALGLPVLVLLLWLSIRRGLGPLTALSREIADRKPDSLVQLNESKTPQELRPIVLALNDLLRRMTYTLENERRFTDNAAHELRTPLAAIQAHLYAASKTTDPSEHSRAMAQVQRGVDRSIRLVAQMLTLARLGPQQALPGVGLVNLGDMAQNVCADLAPLALQRDQTLELRAQPDVASLPGNPDLLSMLLSNLVDNAIRYTPRGGHIQIAVRHDAAGLQMAVCDDGPGIELTQRERVFNRFYRLADQSQPGTGLGLAICRSIAELHRAKISLSEGINGCGLMVSVTFPASSVDAA